MTVTWDDALGALAAERYPRLLGRAVLLCGDRSLAEDLVQEALVATLKRQRKFESLAQAEQYVRRAIATRYVDAVRSASASRRRELAAYQGEAYADPAASVGLAMDLGAALQTLPPRVRACVALRYLDELSVRETADALSLSEGAVKRYVSDGIRALNALLGTSDSAEERPTAPVKPTGGRP